MSRLYEARKRAFDVAAAGAVLVATAPVQAAIAVLVWRDLGRPILYRQVRPGKDGLPFTMHKFRTMRDVGPSGELDDAQRLTELGSFLRSTSLDELPSLWNVVRGDMSLVGPRPLLFEYLPLYSPHQARRHEVRPGLTGLAQVRGRNLLAWEERLALDVEYVDRRTWTLDLKILRATTSLVVRRTGVSSLHSVTMDRFTGTGA